MLPFWRLKMQKTEFKLNDLLSAGIIIVVTGLVLAFGLEVLGDVQSDMTASSAEYNATGDAITGVAKIPEKLSIIATVVVAAVIIGLLIRAFSFR